MNEHEIAKGLEVWILQNLLNASILMGIMVSGLLLAQGYYRELNRHLNLRVSRELWNLFTVILADVLLVGMFLVGYVVLNPDIMADIKMAVPFYPVASLLFAAALILRLFKGGHEAGTSSFNWALRLSLAANAINMVGFTFVAEAASDEYLARHASPFWTYLKTHLRSNADPIGLEVAQATFFICFPILLLLCAWAVKSAMVKMKQPRAKE
ncbi:hypothetical protein GETHLI_09110 [Geothrix limicola]|uniref:Uncharacterized protein n=1 Tax=Geothrix limicola TaxID=2927978 RepID=A0ABQ5QCW5_9BACT|nr:hypothetical protein [Geothrix limicola]GLH72409.1 hypothetical protein GETHLI_09110 [Geothrix limicola]